MKNNVYIHILMDKARGTKYHPSTVKMSAKDAFILTEAELKRLNNIIRNKVILDEHIGHSIFKQINKDIDERRLDTYVKDHFTAAYYAFIDLRESMEKDHEFNFSGIKKYGYLINEILYDVMPFANYIGKKNDSSYYFFHGSKSFIDDSRWHYLGTYHLLYNSLYKEKMLDNKFSFILSPVALRQTIELKMQRIMGVADFYDKNGQKIYTTHHYFFDFILRNKSYFDLGNINIKIIQKIFDFCNISVHKGIMPYYWQMFYAIKFCESLFFDPNYAKSKNFNINSAIKVKGYNELKQKLEMNLKDKFPSPEFDLKIVWITPEAQIL